MKIFRRIFVAGILCASVASVMAQADPGWPSKPVRIVLPYAAGGPTDLLARGLSEKLTTLWGQQVLVDNRPGASEILGADAVAKAAPDGYTLLMGLDAAFSWNSSLFAKLPYNPVTDLTPISHLVNVNMALIVKSSLPVNNMQEFVSLMKREGINHNYAATSKGSPFLALRTALGFDMTEVLYKGTAPALLDMMGGSIDAVLSGPSVVASHLQSGKIKLLAISGTKRASAFPDVPTFAEAGYPNIEARVYVGLAGPKGLSPDLVAKISTDVQKVFSDKQFVAKYVDATGFSAIASSPAQFADFLKRDRETSAQRFKAAGVVPQ